MLQQSNTVNKDNKWLPLLRFIESIQRGDHWIYNATLTGCSPVFSNINVSIPESQSKLIVIYGDNSSGKSFFAKLMATEALHDTGIHPYIVSMAQRTASYGKMFFGNESFKSTGVCSISATLRCLESAIKDEKTALVVLDEPDVGLSDYYSPALGEHIGQKLNGFSDNKMMIVISHSKHLLSGLLGSYQGSCIEFGINTEMSLSDWSKRTERATVAELLELQGLSSDIRNAISDVKPKTKQSII
ncbi:hypothetical protein NDJ00_23490 [Vibrio parahaemolyticus]|uniref:hypothetical protein n=1 Tax=Vibrio parahaemolyticus TaxID=670 RepID=UPI0006C6C510|nr:hypothetical protein [Vibrio parahaemolyticus]EGR5926529.1 hypothetical protein [Vibrio parahaemolyticus]KOY41102.1 hypothetical protein ACX10_01995 [Vibrio parahaemolyticus]MCS0117144.1 hypothetical protein [Vibrio parahaemolyticus]